MQDRLISKKEVRHLTSLSFATIDRKEKAGQFPVRIRLGQARVAWWESAVREWMAQLTS